MADDILLLGCGKMGGALLKGWLQNGVQPRHVTVLDPHPGAWLLDLQMQGLRLNVHPKTPPQVLVAATKPQIMRKAIPQLASYGNGETLVLSIAAGTPISTFCDMLGASTPIIRAMPNTPASIGAGITALIGTARVTEAQRSLAEILMSSVGETVWLDNEDQMHAVTGLSGSGPAYIFAFAEAMIAAGTELGLPEALAYKLATATIAGSGRLLTESDRAPSDLRGDVTSPNGTTAAGLARLMGENNGIQPLMAEVISAAEARSRELAENL